MKQFILFTLAALFGFALPSCHLIEPADQDSAVQVTTSPKSETPIVLLANSSNDVVTDSTPTAPTPVFDADSSAHVACIHRLRRLDESSIEPSEVLVGLTKFLGQSISESSAFLFLVNRDTIKLYIDYFEGDIKGSKVFYIAAGELMGVDILTVQKQWTEGGEQMNSVLTHSFYYKDRELLCCENHQHAEQQALLEQENEQDWRIIRRSLQIL
jgi:hypothetical protein